MRIFKKPIFMFVLGLVIAGSIGVIAVNLSANNISYGNGTVKDALDELYSSSKGVSCLYLSGTKGQIGSRYICDPGDGVARNFYILKVDTNEVKLIMEQNLSDTVGTQKMLDWDTAMSFFFTGAGSDIKTSWKNVSDISLPDASDIAAATNITSWDGSTSMNDPYFGGSTSARVNYTWLYNYTRGCVAVGSCSNEYGDTDQNHAYGYWTSSSVSDNQNSAWQATRGGNLEKSIKSYSTYSGVRPVITMQKTQLN